MPPKGLESVMADLEANMECVSLLPSARAIADRTGLSRDQVNKCIAYLRECGPLGARIQERTDLGGRLVWTEKSGASP